MKGYVGEWRLIYVSMTQTSTNLPNVCPLPANGLTFDALCLKSSCRWSSMCTCTMLPPCWRNSGGNWLQWKRKSIETELLMANRWEIYPLAMHSKNSLFRVSSYVRNSPSLMVNPWRHKRKMTGSMLCGRLARASGNATWSSFVWPKR